MPGDPTRVRLVDGWGPPWAQWLFFAAIAPVVSVANGLRHRGSGDAPRRRRA